MSQQDRNTASNDAAAALMSVSDTAQAFAPPRIDEGAQPREPLSESRPSGPTLAELINDYMKTYAGRDPTQAARLNWWIVRLGTRAVMSITDDDVFAAVEALTQEPARRFKGHNASGAMTFTTWQRAPATINRYLNGLAGVFTWAIKRRRVPKTFDNPCRKIQREPESAGVVRFLRDDERERLLAACKISKWKRLYLLVLMAITTGARRGELLALRGRDLDFKQACAHVCTSKNGEPRVLPLVPTVLAELKRLRVGADCLVFASRLRPDKPYVISVAWSAARTEAKLENFRFHDLRHTCASYLAQQGASLLEIADVMGHRQLTMTKRYAHLTVGSKTSLVHRILGDIR